MSAGRSIPSLDGLRAVAVLCVIFGHTQSAVLNRSWLMPFRNGSLGVTGFFVISGFLITRLLVNEIDRSKKIDLARFYMRRSFRIFPPFYVYILVVACMCLLGYAHINALSFTTAATYTWNYSLHSEGWLLGHTWSLSLEEQFYLLWPICLFFLPVRTCLKIAVAVVTLSPASRVLTYYLVPAMRSHIDMMLHTHVDAIMAGCVITLAQYLGLFTRLIRSLARPAWLFLIIPYFVIQPFLEARFRGNYSLPVGMTLDALACCILLLHVVERPGLPLGRLMNWPPLTHIGRISYSLYLWQQMFTGPRTGIFPLNIVWIFLCAEASYRLIELPSFHLRDRVMSKFMPRKAGLPQMAKASAD